MKTSFIKTFLLLAALWVIEGYSQQYVPISESNASWIVYSIDSHHIHYNQFIVLPTADDTIINGTQYTKLYLNYLGWPRPNNLSEEYSKDGPFLFYWGAFRNTNDGKVYYIPGDDFYFTTEQLLFDFSKNEGDTIYDVLIEISNVHYLIDYRVDSVRYKQFGPHSLKCLYLKPLSEDFPCDLENSPQYFDGTCYLTWIEGLGSIRNGGIINMVNSGFDGISFLCLNKNDTIYYDRQSYDNWEENLTYEPGICFLPVGLDEMSDLYKHINVSPNPIHNSLQIDNLPQDSYELAFYNTLGIKTYNMKVESNSNTLILNGLNMKPGIYIFEIISNNKRFFTQKVIIQ